ncbi:MAG: sugar transferase [Bacteroidia bacterium]|nr:sugar transferase [Bacteroidia bacterium]
MKRLFDFFSAFIALTILFFPLIIVAIWIKLDSDGPVFFMQERLGLNRKRFKVFKFRTMTNRKREVVQVFANDPEITSVGKYLRRFKIDELPQLINVLLGDMSIVGPRPCVDFVAEKQNLCNERFLDKPGLTSLAGVSGSIYLSWPEKDYFDKFYHYNKSFYMDLIIIVKTVLVIVFGEKKFLNKPKID